MRVVCIVGEGGGIWRGEAAALVTELAADPGLAVERVGADWEPEGAAAVDCLVCGIGYGGLRRLPPAVAWVQLWATGVDQVPPEAYGDGRTVTCVRGASAVPIAEFVLASMLAFEKQVPDVWRTEAGSTWFQADLGGLAGRRLAILGFGSIGAEVARRALAFEMSVVGLRSGGRPIDVEGVEAASDACELVADADHVVVAAPATAATYHVVGPEVLARTGPGAHLVNVARGTLVDHDALRNALDDGRVARASLDVTDPEPLPAGHWLYRHPSVRISPHVSWSGPGAGRRILDHCVENIRARARGDALKGIVDPVAGY